MRASLRSCGRLVLNHSTHCEGLVAALNLLRHSPLISSIVPGRIASSRGSSSGLALRLSVPTAVGWKLIARRGGAVQEVFIVTTAARTPAAALLGELRRLLPADIAAVAAHEPAAAQ
jgi:hypothetical protein